MTIEEKLHEIMVRRGIDIGNTRMPWSEAPITEYGFIYRDVFDCYLNDDQVNLCATIIGYYPGIDVFLVDATNAI